VSSGQVPSVLLQAMIETLGEIAPPTGIFDRGDVVVVGRNRRFSFFWKADDKWVVATEHGGFAPNFPIFLYDLREDEQRAVLLAEEIASARTVCLMASGLIARKPT
jgi:hypothetical protein